MKHCFNLLYAFLRYLLELPLQAASLIVVPVACLFVAPRDGKNRLPGWAAWFDEYDYGPDGDEGWQGPDNANGHQQEYWWRVRFLLRNRINTFSKLIEGFRSKDVADLVLVGDIKVSNRPGHSGLMYIEARLKNGKQRFEYYYIRQWGNSGRCIRIRIGWKLKDLMEEYLEDGILGNRPTREWVQFCFVINPVMGFTRA